MKDPRYGRVSLQRILCICALALAVDVLPARATPVIETGPLWGTDSGLSLTGCRSSGTGTDDCPTGLTGLGDYVTGFTLSWSITSPLPIDVGGNGTGYWSYTYTLTVPYHGHEINHAIFGLTPEVCLLPDGKPNDFCVVDATGVPLNSTQIGQFDPGASLPGLPNWIVGARFLGSGTSVEIQFYSPNAPVWGDFYGKGVQDSVWNIGLENVALDQSDPNLWFALHYDQDPFNFIARPDGQQAEDPVPEPVSLAMVGGGLLALAYGLRKARRM